MIGQGNPYPGPRAFRTGEALHGRDRESRELTDLLIAERIVLFYAPSGAGKTSLIRAALIPEMQAEGYRILPIARPGAATDAAGGDASGNPYVARVIAVWEEGRPEGEPVLADVSGIRLATYLSQRDWIQAGERLTLIIFDQFEEILTSGEDEDVKIGFFEQLGEALRDQRLWALFSMREEYSAALDSFRYLLPTRLATRLRLELLSRSEALEAIRNPAAAARVDFTDAAVQHLLDELGTVKERTSDGEAAVRRVPFIEPLHLQIICHRLWDQLPESTRTITPEHLEQGERRAGVGKVEEALEEYYASVVAEVSARTGVHKRRIRDWLEQELVTPQGLRRQALRGERETAGLVNWVVEALEGHYLLRSEARGGARWYEVTHDRLAAVILQGNARWFERHLQPFQIRAGIWSRMRRAGAYQSAAREILKGVELREAEQWERSHREEVTKVDREYLGYCREEWNRGRRVRWQRAGIVLAAAAAVVTIAVVLWIKNAQILRESERGRATAMLSASASAKWRSHNHELASLLAIQAYRLAMRHGQEQTLGPRTEAFLRAALQSQPFAYGMSLSETARTAGDSRILLSRQPGLVAVRTGERSYRLRREEGSRWQTREIAARGRIIKAGFTPQDRFLALLTAAGLELHPVAADGGDARLVPTGAPPLGPFCFSRDGQRAAIVVEPGDIQMWKLGPLPPARVATMAAGGPTLPAGAAIAALACDVSGSILAWGDREGRVGVVDLTGKQPVLLWSSPSPNRFEDWPEDLQLTLQHRRDAIDLGVSSLHFLPHHGWLLAVYRQGPPRIYDLGGIEEGPLAAYLMPDTQSAVALQIAQDRSTATRRVVSLERFLTADVGSNERRIAIGGARALVGLWDLATLSADPDEAAPVRINRDQTVVYASYAEIPGLSASIRAIRFTHPSERAGDTEDEIAEPWLAAADARSNVRWWILDVLQGVGYRSYRTWTREPGTLYALAFLAPPKQDPTALRLAFGGTLNSGVLRIDPGALAVTPDKAFRLPIRIRALAADVGAHHLLIATGNVDNAAWKSQQYSWLLYPADGDGGEARALPGEPHTDGQWAALTNAEGTLLLTAGWDGRAVIWRPKQAGGWQPQTLIAPAEPPVPGTQILSAALAPNGRDLAFGTFGAGVGLWRDEGNGFRKRESLLDLEIPVHALAYSPDGGRLIAGDDDGVLWSWGIEGGAYRPAPPISAHEGTIYAAAFGADGTLVTGGSDGNVYVWRTARGEPDPRRRLRLDGPKSEIVGVALAPSGQLVAACDSDGEVHLWELGLPGLIERACAAMGRNLSKSEWKTYMGSDEDYACTCPNLGPGPGVRQADLAPSAGCAASSFR